jgi:hypothetical protein
METGCGKMGNFYQACAKLMIVSNGATLVQLECSLGGAGPHLRGRTVVT